MKEALSVLDSITELELVDTMPTDTAITNVLSETRIGKEVIPHPAYSVQQRTSDRPTALAKKYGGRSILTLFFMRFLAFIGKKTFSLLTAFLLKRKAEKEIPLQIEAPKDPLTAKRLPNPSSENYQLAKYFNWGWRKHGGASSCICATFSEAFNVPVDKTSLNTLISKVLNEAWRTCLPPDEAVEIITAEDFPTIVATIRKLKNKVGIAELATAILLAHIVDSKLYKESGCNSDTAFFAKYSEPMGISSSRARDYCNRGLNFLKFREDILEGVGDVPGIPLEEVASSHMSKLTIYHTAVEKFGRQGALSKMKSLSFRDFQNELAKPKNKIAQNDAQTKQSPVSSTDNDELDVHEEQKALILEMDLSDTERRLLRIIAKGGIVHPVEKLNDEQLKRFETLIRQRRVEALKKELRCAPSGFQRKSYDPSDPLAISDDLYSLTNIGDIVLRIKDGLALVVPVRRTIAVLTYKLYHEKQFKFYWSSPKAAGGERRSFRDFAMDELGMGEEYRDYLAVGKVLYDYYYFLDGLSDMDTEDVFFKLKYLPQALETHEGDECLVLARLRSLSVREFKMFSELPDFETTFSKKLTNKQLEQFYTKLTEYREIYKKNDSTEFVEAYHANETGMIRATVNDILWPSQAKETVDTLTQPEGVSVS